IRRFDVTQGVEYRASIFDLLLRSFFRELELTRELPPAVLVLVGPRQQQVEFLNIRSYRNISSLGRERPSLLCRLQKLLKLRRIDDRVDTRDRRGLLA